MPASRRARASGNENTDLRWWLKKRGEMATTIFDLDERVSRLTRARRDQDLFFACLYDDTELAQLIQGDASVTRFAPQTMTANIVKRQVDAYVARVSKNRPLPMALTEGGNWSQQRRARAFSRFSEGVLKRVGYYKLRPIRLRDSALFGSGFAHNYRKGRRLFHKRKYSWDFQVDPREALYGDPRTIIVNHVIDTLVLKDTYPKFADKIADSKQGDKSDRFEVNAEDTSDMRVVKEPWRLPTSEDSEDGKHAVAVSEAVIELGDYDRDYFPFSKVDFSPPVMGWFGEGMVKQLAGLQYEVNAIGLRMQEQGYLTGSYVMVEDGSGVETDMLDNGALTVVKYRGTKPEWQHPPPWHPGFFDYYLRLRGSFASDVTGMSQTAVRGEKEGGLDSGKALRIHHDYQDENFTVQGRLDEEDCIDTAWQFFDLMEEIEHDDQLDDGERSYEVKFAVKERGQNVLRKQDFKSVRLDRENFDLDVFPTSFLSSTPEDKWSQVAEMAKAGLFAEDELLSLLDYPDVERVLNLRNAGRRVIEAIVEKFLESDTPPAIVPEPTMNLDLAVVIGTLAYLEAKWLDGAPEKNTSALLTFVMAAKTMRDTAKGPANMPPPGPGQAPEANGAPPLYAPPDQQPLPAGAAAPEVMPPPGGGGPPIQ